MMWVNSSTGAVLRTHSELRQDAQRVSFPGVITDAMIAAHGYVAVVPTAPTYNPATQKAVEADPVKIGDVWTQQWVVSNLQAQEIAEKVAAQKNVQATIDAKADTKLEALGSMTPAEVRSWVGKNVKNVADSVDLLATLAVAVSVLTRKL